MMRSQNFRKSCEELFNDLNEVYLQLPDNGVNLEMAIVAHWQRKLSK